MVAAAVPFTGPFIWPILGLVVVAGVIVVAGIIWVLVLSSRQGRN